MSDAVTIFFDVSRGQLRIDNLPALNAWLSKHEGFRGRATFEATIQEKRERTIKFYRFVLLKRAGEHEGNDPLEQHAVYWRHLQPCAVWPNPTERIDIDVAHLTDGELSRYVQDAVRLAASNGCLIPERP